MKDCMSIEQINLTSSDAAAEKRAAALSSVAAAIGLTAFKIIVGVLTGSLGILAEAAHSALDLVAALVTFFAVRAADRPADQEHNYGHGKIENLSALFETLLLLVTCVWIIYEAMQRLFVAHVAVEVSIWAFLVMAVSIMIDFSRSRLLKQAAVKHNSQALEADALHFSTDIWSSSVVILGLIAVWMARRIPGLEFLEKADAVAALGVALIVIWVSLQLGKRTIQGLLDSAPSGMQTRIREAALSVPGVAGVHAIRMRGSGAQTFADIHLELDAGMDLEKAHQLTDLVEREIFKLMPGVDITVHPEPIATVPPAIEE